MTPDKKIWLEIGTGNGDFLFSLAAQNPAVTFVGLEIRNRRFNNMIRRREKLNLNNIILIQGRGEVVLPALFRNHSLEKIFILFPDPWPKRRHAKHRLFQPDFVRDLHHRLRPKGDVVVATDDPVYRREIIEQFSSGAPFRYRELDNPFPTFYAEKWREEGRRLYAFSFKKC